MEYEKAVFEQDFLLLSYSRMGFFINRSQFSGSTSLENVKKIKSPLPYFDSIFSYNGEKVLLFDCDAFLRAGYRCENEGSSRLCLLMKLSDFGPTDRPAIAFLLGKNPALSQEFLGLIITSRAEIKKIRIDEIHLSPPGVRETLKNQGLYGCRFPGDNRIQFYIDLETTVLNILKRKAG